MRNIMLPLEIANLLNKASSNGDATVVIVPDDAHRPPVSVSESSWNEVPALCRHRGRHSARSLKKRTSASRWGGSEESSAAKQTQELKLQAQVEESTTSSNSCKPLRKASMDMSTQEINKFQRTRNLCKPMRKASVDMSAPVNNSAAPVPGLTKPMRKASMEMAATQDENKIQRTRNLFMPMRKASIDMANADRSHRQGYLKEHRHNSAPLLGYTAAMDQSSIMGGDDYECSESSSEGDGCMIDLIRSQMPRRSGWNNESTSEQEEDYGYTDHKPTIRTETDDEVSASSDEGGCMLDHVRSMPQRGGFNNEFVAEQEDYGYTDHKPTRRVETDDEASVSSHDVGCMLDHVLSLPRPSSGNNDLATGHEDYGYTDHHPTLQYEGQSEHVDEKEESERDGSDCMINMVKNLETVNHSPQHQKREGLSRPQRKASIDMCGGGNAVIDMIGINAMARNRCTASTNNRQNSTRRARRASLNMGSVDMAHIHISTAPAVQ